MAVVPFGIVRVTTGQGRVLYEHQAPEPRVLVAPWVAAQMIDMMRATVELGTGRGAAIGRPIAGKTGTTSSNKDGWFLGFSSGITTGVWMGRDDAKPVGGLQGGRAPAKAFADFMRVAVARRPVETFDTEVKLPEWQLEEDDDAMFGAPEEGGLVDENGMPIELPGAVPPPDGGDIAPPPAEDGPVLNQQWLEEPTGRRLPSDTGAAPKGAQPAPAKAPPPVIKLPPARAPQRDSAGDGN
jgi:penicillin-binding protein 1A